MNPILLIAALALQQTPNARALTGKGPIRTGVTAILPRGKLGPDSAFAAWFTLNGNLKT